ncbi:MAG: ion transporter [Eggerthellaceae bacterium]
MGAARRNAGHAGCAGCEARAPPRPLGVQAGGVSRSRRAARQRRRARRGHRAVRAHRRERDPRVRRDAARHPGRGVGGASGLRAGVQRVLRLGYAARLWTADLVHPDASPARARMRYALSPMGIIDLLAFAPGLLVLFVPVSSSMLNAARIIRLVRLIKLSRYMRGLRSIARCSESAVRRSWRHSWCSPCSP